MHHYTHDNVEALALETMEKHFIASPTGRKHAAEYNEIQREMEIAHTRYKEMWQKIKPELMEYMRNL